MTRYPWTTLAVFVVLLVQFILFWLQAKKTGKSVRDAFLPHALVVGAVSIILVRELFGDLPLWIDAPILILNLLMILIALVIGLVRLKRYIKGAWRLEDKKDR